MLAHVRKLFSHIEWADARLLQALRSAPTAPPEAVREYAHVLGADETWLARLEGRPARTAIWPTLTLAELQDLAATVHASYRRYLDTLADPALGRSVTYTNSAGKTFQNMAADLLVHVALHAQYHRGKVNLLLRQAGLEPAPTDYIAFVRGTAAAVTPVTPQPGA